MRRFKTVSISSSMFPLFDALNDAVKAYEMLLAGRNIADSRSASVAFFREKIAIASVAFDRLIHKMEKDLVETLQNAANR